MTTTSTSFDHWMQAVDLAVAGIAGLSVYDLADQPYRDWHEDGLSAPEAAQEALLDEGFPEELLFSLDDGDDTCESNRDKLQAEIDDSLNIAPPEPATAVASTSNNPVPIAIAEDDWGF